MKVIKDGNNTVLSDVKDFDAALTLDCGQAFRWKERDGGFSGIAFKKHLFLKQEGETVTLFNTTPEEFENIWRRYFDFDRDYGKITEGYTDEYLKVACSAYPGIRILRQEPWETVCSFIISANNNIPRIKGIIERLCEMYGEKIDGGFSFPEPEALRGLSVEDLAPVRSGFRAKYILDAAKKLSSGEVSFEKIENGDFDTAKAELLKIKGVGEKVAQCALLYGFGRVEAFPRDVWVKRIESELYPDGLPECIKGTEGIAQQYLFHWRRSLEKTV